MIEQLKLSGYDDRKQLLAQRYTRDGKSLFIVSLPIHLVATHLPIPDPAEPFEGNRRVNETHAAKFGDYWRENIRWATPPLLLDTTFPLTKEFEPKFSAGGVEFGILYLPHNSADELEILDGQHRILGWKLITGRIIDELKRAREQLMNSRDVEDAIGIDTYERKVAELDAQVNRMRNEYITLEILEGVTIEEHKQFFHDIAVNAKGITKSVTVGFDRRNLINRVAMSVAESDPLLGGRIEMEKDRVTGGNENLISGKNLVDLVKGVAIGIDGRMTHRREKTFKESHIESMADRYFSALRECFPDLQKVADDELHPVDLRSSSLLGSPTILRIFAGAYHDLAIDASDDDNPKVTDLGDKMARNLFEALAPHMALPIGQGWFDTGFFPETTSKAPSSRSQDLTSLTRLVTSWGANGGIFTLQP